MVTGLICCVINTLCSCDECHVLTGPAALPPPPPPPVLTPAGLLTTAFEENPRLKRFFNVLALSLDNVGLPYISLMEAKEVCDTCGRILSQPAD